jgi:putative oxidoreductase
MAIHSIIITRKDYCQLIAGLLVLLFSYTALSKLGDLKTFEWQMLNQPLPSWANHALVWVLPSMEIILVVLLALKRTQRYGLIASTLLMFVFTIYVAGIVFHFFNRVPCSCGGVLQSLKWEVHLVFNLFVTAISVAGVWMGRRK